MVKTKARRQRCYVCNKLFSPKQIVEVEYSPVKGKVTKKKVCMPHSGNYKTGLEIEESD